MLCNLWKWLLAMLVTNSPRTGKMITYDMDEMTEELDMDEGREQFLYQDDASPPNWTIGVGWNIQSKGLPDEIIDRLLAIGIHEAEGELDREFPFWRELSPIRQRVMVNMMYNMGADKFNQAEWPKFSEALIARNYPEVGKQMHDSSWRRQVKSRATRLRKMMERG